MKKLIFILLISLIGCDLIDHDPLQDIEVGQIDNYDFENDIQVSSIEEAIQYTRLNLDYKKDIDIWNLSEYWQSPEETYQSKTGDCEDYCILLMYLIKSKLTKNCYFIDVKDLLFDKRHVLVYSPDLNKYIDPIVYFAYTEQELIDNFYQINYIIPYPEIIWMTINYHQAVGKYLITSD